MTRQQSNVGHSRESQTSRGAEPRLVVTNAGVFYSTRNPKLAVGKGGCFPPAD